MTKQQAMVIFEICKQMRHCRDSLFIVLITRDTERRQTNKSHAFSATHGRFSTVKCIAETGTNVLKIQILKLVIKLENKAQVSLIGYNSISFLIQCWIQFLYWWKNRILGSTEFSAEYEKRIIRWTRLKMRQHKNNVGSHTNLLATALVRI